MAAQPKGTTPGPWKARDRGYNIDIHGSRGVVASIDAQADDDAEANAHLISAAPEMYEVLLRFIEWGSITGVPWSTDALKLAQRVLAKAEGRDA